MGYDIEFVSFKVPPEVSFPVDAASTATLVSASAAALKAREVRDALLAVPGCKSGPDDDTVDYLGGGLSYARLSIRPKAVHVENNCGAKDVLKLQSGLAKAIGPVFILDLQSGQLHDANSFSQWWARPL